MTFLVLAHNNFLAIKQVLLYTLFFRPLYGEILVSKELMLLQAANTGIVKKIKIFIRYCLSSYD